MKRWTTVDVPTATRLTPECREALEAIARSDEVSLASVVRKACETYLKRRKK